MFSTFLLPRRLIIALAVTASLGLGMHADAAPVITIAPSSGGYTVGDTFSLTLDSTGLTNLYAFQFGLTFTPGVLGLTDVTEGNALSSAGTTFFVPGTADNAAGLLTLTGNTLVGPITGFSGDGWLATIVFQALSAGIGSVQLTDLTFLDADLNIIDIGSTAGGSFVVTAATRALPEPAGSVLAMLALASAAVARRRKR